MRVWDVRRSIQALQEIEGVGDLPLELRGRGVAGGIALYASLFESGIDHIVLDQLPPSHRRGPIFLNVLRYLDMPQAVAIAADRCPVRLRETEPGAWGYPRRVAESLGWDGSRLRVGEAQPDGE